MASHQLQRRALRFPPRKKTPPHHAARIFPSCAPGLIVMENGARRLRNWKETKSPVRLAPLRLPNRTLEQLMLVLVIPQFAQGKDGDQPRERDHRSARGDRA